jgi:hypothetical protein
VLTASRWVLGTVAAMNNLAWRLRGWVTWSRRAGCKNRSLDASRRVLSDEHPDTLTAANNLAATLSAMGDLVGARALKGG